MTAAVADRTVAAAPPRPPRRQPRALAVLVALVVAAVAVTVVVDIIAVAADNRTLVWPARRITRDLRTTTWTDTTVLVVGIVVGVVGLLLLARALLPGRPLLLAIEPDGADETAGLSTRSLLRALRRAAESVPGVDSAAVRLRNRNRLAEVRIDSGFRDAGDLPAKVNDTLRAVIADLRLAHPPAVDATWRAERPSTGRNPGPAPVGVQQ